MADRIAVRIEPWSADDLALLEKLMGDPAMMEHLGGTASPAKIAARHVRYMGMTDSGAGRMFKVVDTATGEA